MVAWSAVVCRLKSKPTWPQKSGPYWCRALAARRSEVVIRESLRRGLPHALCRNAAAQARLFARHRTSAASGTGRPRSSRIQKLAVHAEGTSLRPSTFHCERKWSCGSRAKPELVRRTGSCGNGQGVERGSANRLTSATKAPTCSAQFARRAAVGAALALPFADTEAFRLK